MQCACRAPRHATARARASPACPSDLRATGKDAQHEEPDGASATTETDEIYVATTETCIYALAAADRALPRAAGSRSVFDAAEL